MGEERDTPIEITVDPSDDIPEIGFQPVQTKSNYGVIDIEQNLEWL
jgi:hypothetical protein